MKIKIDELPLSLEIASGSVCKTRWDDMDVAVVQAKAGSTAPLDPSRRVCPSKHWGLILEGQMVVTYTDGRSEELSEGEVFYIEAGHTANFIRDTRFLEITPSTSDAK